MNPLGIGGEEDAAVNQLMAEGMGQAAQAQAGRGMPMRNLRQENGFGFINNPVKFMKEGMMPFDSQSSSARNYAGIVNSFNPQLFGVSENLINQANQLGPQAQQALAYKGSIYTGVPDDFATNRLYIYNTRKREDSIYAFV